MRLAVHDMERAGIDIVSDGEQRRESYFNQFATALEGLDLDRPGTAISRAGPAHARAAGRRPHPPRPARAPSRRPVPAGGDGAADQGDGAGALHPGWLAQDEHYRDEERLAMAYAAAVNEELRELEPLVDVLQLDEPYLQAQPDRARAYAIPAIDRALAGLVKPTAVHLCFGYAHSHALAGTTKPSGYSFLPELERCAARQVSIEAAQPGLDLAVLETLPSKTIVLGVLDLGDPTPETPDVVARRLDAALRRLPAARLVAAPDCGMKYLPARSPSPSSRRSSRGPAGSGDRDLSLCSLPSDPAS